MATSSMAFAVQTLEPEYFCAEDVSNVGSCTANEVSLSGVTNVTVSDLDDNVLTECTAGQPIKIVTLDAELDSNTGTRFDVTFWIGRFGNDPRIATGNPSACVALSLPDDTGSAFIADFEGGANTDNCEDLAQPPATLPINFGGGAAELTCADSNDDGIADLQVVTTWHQNENFACGLGDPSLSPGAPSKCDYVLIDLVPFVVNPTMSIDKTVTDVDGAGAGGSVDEAGDVITYQVLVTNTGEVALSNVGVGDPLLADLACNPAVPVVSLAPAAVITCTGTYTATQADIDQGGTIDNEAFAISDETGVLNDNASVPIVQDADWTIDKTVTDVGGDGAAGSVNAAGDVISYQVVVTNTGNTTLTGVSVADPLFDAAPVCNPVAPATLAPAAVMTCTGSYTALQADLDNDGGGDGDIDNTATASSTELEDITDSAAVPVAQASNYTIVKSVTDVGGDGAAGSVNAAGDVISYQVVVTNTGNTTLTGVSVADPLFDAPPVCNPVAPATLAPAAVMTCTGSYTALQADLDNSGGGDGDIDNTATASSNQLDDITDSADVPVSQVPVYTVVKSVTDVGGDGAAGSVDADGDVISYQVVVTNTGNTTLTGVSVADPLFDAAPVCNPVAPATLAPAAVMTCTGSYTALQADLDNNGGGDGDIDNTATASSNELDDESDNAAVPIEGAASYSIAKAVTDVAGGGPGGVVDAAGDVISYSVVVTNTGDVTLTNVSVADPLFDAPPECNPVAPATLEPDEVMTCTGAYTAQQSDLDNDGNPVPGSMEIANTATVSSDELPDDSDNATVPVVATGAYTITKTVTDVDGAGPGGSVDEAGDVISYSIEVLNNGNITLNGVTVADSLIAGLVCNPVVPATLAPGAGISCTGMYAATQADIDTDGGGNGIIENTATLSSEELGDETDSANVPVVFSPAMTLEKASTTTAVDEPGVVIPYTYVITNTGNATLNNVSLADNNVDATPVCNPVAPATLAPAAVMNCTAQHTVTQQEYDTLSSIDNIATATSTETQPVQDTLSIPVNRVIFEVLTEVCVNDTPFVDYDVSVSEGVVSDVTITWIKDDGSMEVVETILGAPAVGQLLWPGAAVVDGVPVAWPGWSCDAMGQNCVEIDDGLRPTMILRFEINPTSEVVVSYPQATPACNANPQEAPPPPGEHIPVPVNNPLAIILMTLMMLTMGWYFRPGTMRR